MEYQESIHQSAELFRMVAQRIVAHKHPYDPVYYGLWYEFLLDQNKPLISAMNGALPAELDRSSASELYYSHIATANAEIISGIQGEVYRLAQALVENLGDSAVEVRSSRQTLIATADKLEQNHDVTALSALVDSIIACSGKLCKHSESLEARMRLAMTQVNQLQNELQQVRCEAITDPLTGLANRRAFDSALMDVMADNQLGQRDLCLLMLDIDLFKDFNDKHGHLVGDKVLAFVAKMIKAQVKGKDLVSRFGGEEFAVILIDTPLQGAKNLAEQIRKAVAKAVLKQSANAKPLGNVTLSVGVAKYRSDESSHEFIDRCDKAMYLAKTSGRNQVRIAGL